MLKEVLDAMFVINTKMSSNFNYTPKHQSDIQKKNDSLKYPLTPMGVLCQAPHRHERKISGALVQVGALTRPEHALISLKLKLSLAINNHICFFVTTPPPTNYSHKSRVCPIGLNLCMKPLFTKKIRFDTHKQKELAHPSPLKFFSVDT